MIDPTCWACRNGVRHDERSAADCVHRASSGVPSLCCLEAIEARMALIGGVLASRRGAGPKTPAPVTFDEDFERDPVGAVWSLMDAEGD